jgi:TPR repeat protein
MGFKEYAAFTKKQKAANYFRLSCELTNYRSCHNLATMYKLGDGVAKDMEMYQHYKDIYDAYYQQYYV